MIILYLWLLFSASAGVGDVRNYNVFSGLRSQGRKGCFRQSLFDLALLKYLLPFFQYSRTGLVGGRLLQAPVQVSRGRLDNERAQDSAVRKPLWRSAWGADDRLEVVELFRDAVIALRADGSLWLVQGREGRNGVENQALLCRQVWGGEAAVVLGGRQNSNQRRRRAGDGWHLQGKAPQLEKIVIEKNSDKRAGGEQENMWLAHSAPAADQLESSLEQPLLVMAPFMANI